jgi:UPF0755 protein
MFNSWFNFSYIKSASIVGIVVGIIFYFAFLSAPFSFHKDTTITIPDGASLSSTATILKEDHIIKSKIVFIYWLKILGNDDSIKSGDYLFSKSENVFSVAKRVVKGDYGLMPVRVTIPEGLNSFEIAEILVKTLLHFDKEKFLILAQKKEGYLFPDTYFFVPNQTEEMVVRYMVDNFERKIKSIQSDIDKFKKPVDQVVTMASIVEDEGRTVETRRTIAGILWKRLDKGMPLQVDATFKYINGKTTFDLTKADLALKSPYNTYLYKGLPPTAITNPGLTSIEATINPIQTPYLYFLTDSEGVMHYADTFEQHVANKQKYLR